MLLPVAVITIIITVFVGNPYEYLTLVGGGRPQAIYIGGSSKDL